MHVTLLLSLATKVQRTRSRQADMHLVDEGQLDGGASLVAPRHGPRELHVGETGLERRAPHLFLTTDGTHKLLLNLHAIVLRSPQPSSMYIKGQ